MSNPNEYDLSGEIQPGRPSPEELMALHRSKGGDPDKVQEQFENVIRNSNDHLRTVYYHNKKEARKAFSREYYQDDPDRTEWIKELIPQYRDNPQMKQLVAKLRKKFEIYVDEDHDVELTSDVELLSQEQINDTYKLIEQLSEGYYSIQREEQNLYSQEENRSKYLFKPFTDITSISEKGTMEDHEDLQEQIVNKLQDAHDNFEREFDDWKDEQISKNVPDAQDLDKEDFLKTNRGKTLDVDFYQKTLLKMLQRLDYRLMLYETYDKHRKVFNMIFYERVALAIISETFDANAFSDAFENRWLELENLHDDISNMRKDLQPKLYPSINTGFPYKKPPTQGDVDDAKPKDYEYLPDIFKVLNDNNGKVLKYRREKRKFKTFDNDYVYDWVDDDNVPTLEEYLETHPEMITDTYVIDGVERMQEDDEEDYTDALDIEETIKIDTVNQQTFRRNFLPPSQLQLVVREQSPPSNSVLVQFHDNVPHEVEITTPPNTVGDFLDQISHMIVMPFFIKKTYRVDIPTTVKLKLWMNMRGNKDLYYEDSTLIRDIVEHKIDSSGYDRKTKLIHIAENQYKELVNGKTRVYRFKTRPGIISPPYTVDTTFFSSDKISDLYTFIKDKYAYKVVNGKIETDPDREAETNNFVLFWYYRGFRKYADPDDDYTTLMKANLATNNIIYISTEEAESSDLPDRYKAPGGKPFVFGVRTVKVPFPLGLEYMFNQSSVIYDRMIDPSRISAETRRKLYTEDKDGHMILKSDYYRKVMSRKMNSEEYNSALAMENLSLWAADESSDKPKLSLSFSGSQMDDDFMFHHYHLALAFSPNEREYVLKECVTSCAVWYYNRMNIVDAFMTEYIPGLVMLNAIYDNAIGQNDNGLFFTDISDYKGKLYGYNFDNPNNTGADIINIIEQSDEQKQLGKGKVKIKNFYGINNCVPLIITQVARLLTYLLKHDDVLKESTSSFENSLGNYRKAEEKGNNAKIQELEASREYDRQEYIDNFARPNPRRLRKTIESYYSEPDALLKYDEVLIVYNYICNYDLKSLKEKGIRQNLFTSFWQYFEDSNLNRSMLSFPYYEHYLQTNLFTSTVENQVMFVQNKSFDRALNEYIDVRLGINDTIQSQIDKLVYYGLSSDETYKRHIMYSTDGLVRNLVTPIPDFAKLNSHEFLLAHYRGEKLAKYVAYRNKLFGLCEQILRRTPGVTEYTEHPEEVSILFSDISSTIGTNYTSKNYIYKYTGEKNTTFGKSIRGGNSTGVSLMKMHVVNPENKFLTGAPENDFFNDIITGYRKRYFPNYLYYRDSNAHKNRDENREYFMKYGNEDYGEDFQKFLYGTFLLYSRLYIYSLYDRRDVLQTTVKFHLGVSESSEAGLAFSRDVKAKNRSEYIEFLMERKYEYTATARNLKDDLIRFAHVKSPLLFKLKKGKGDYVTVSLDEFKRIAEGKFDQFEKEQISQSKKKKKAEPVQTELESKDLSKYLDKYLISEEIGDRNGNKIERLWKLKATISIDIVRNITVAVLNGTSAETSIFERVSTQSFMPIDDDIRVSDLKKNSVDKTYLVVYVEGSWIPPNMRRDVYVKIPPVYKYYQENYEALYNQTKDTIIESYISQIDKQKEINEQSFMKIESLAMLEEIQKIVSDNQHFFELYDNFRSGVKILTIDRDWYRYNIEPPNEFYRPQNVKRKPDDDDLIYEVTFERKSGEGEKEIEPFKFYIDLNENPKIYEDLSDRSKFFLDRKQPLQRHEDFDKLPFFHVLYAACHNIKDDITQKEKNGTIVDMNDNCFNVNGIEHDFKTANCVDFKDHVEKHFFIYPEVSFLQENMVNGKRKKTYIDDIDTEISEFRHFQIMKFYLVEKEKREAIEKLDDTFSDEKYKKNKNRYVKFSILPHDPQKKYSKNSLCIYPAINDPGDTYIYRSKLDDNRGKDVTNQIFWMLEVKYDDHFLFSLSKDKKKQSQNAQEKRIRRNFATFQANTWTVIPSYDVQRKSNNQYIEPIKRNWNDIVEEHVKMMSEVQSDPDIDTLTLLTYTDLYALHKIGILENDYEDAVMQHGEDLEMCRIFWENRQHRGVITNDDSLIHDFDEKSFEYQVAKVYQKHKLLVANDTMSHVEQIGDAFELAYNDVAGEYYVQKGGKSGALSSIIARSSPGSEIKDGEVKLVKGREDEETLRKNYERIRSFLESKAKNLRLTFLNDRLKDKINSKGVAHPKKDLKSRNFRGYQKMSAAYRGLRDPKAKPPNRPSDAWSILKNLIVGDNGGKLSNTVYSKMDTDGKEVKGVSFNEHSFICEAPDDNEDAKKDESMIKDDVFFYYVLRNDKYKSDKEKDKNEARQDIIGIFSYKIVNYVKENESSYGVVEYDPEDAHHNFVNRNGKSLIGVNNDKVKVVMFNLMCQNESLYREISRIKHRGLFYAKYGFTGARVEKQIDLENKYESHVDQLPIVYALMLMYTVMQEYNDYGEDVHVVLEVRSKADVFTYILDQVLGMQYIIDDERLYMHANIQTIIPKLDSLTHMDWFQNGNLEYSYAKVIIDSTRPDDWFQVENENKIYTSRKGDYVTLPNLEQYYMSHIFGFWYVHAFACIKSTFTKLVVARQAKKAPAYAVLPLPPGSEWILFKEYKKNDTVRRVINSDYNYFVSKSIGEDGEPRQQSHFRFIEQCQIMFVFLHYLGILEHVPEINQEFNAMSEGGFIKGLKSHYAAMIGENGKTYYNTQKTAKEFIAKKKFVHEVAMNNTSVRAKIDNVFQEYSTKNYEFAYWNNQNAASGSDTLDVAEFLGGGRRNRASGATKGDHEALISKDVAQLDKTDVGVEYRHYFFRKFWIGTDVEGKEKAIDHGKMKWIDPYYVSFNISDTTPVYVQICRPLMFKKTSFHPNVYTTAYILDVWLTLDKKSENYPYHTIVFDETESNESIKQHIRDFYKNHMKKSIEKTYVYNLDDLNKLQKKAREMKEREERISKKTKDNEGKGWYEKKATTEFKDKPKTGSIETALFTGRLTKPSFPDEKIPEIHKEYMQIRKKLEKTKKLIIKGQKKEYSLPKGDALPSETLSAIEDEVPQESEADALIALAANRDMAVTEDDIEKIRAGVSLTTLENPDIFDLRDDGHYMTEEDSQLIINEMERETNSSVINIDRDKRVNSVPKDFYRYQRGYQMNHGNVNLRKTSSDAIASLGKERHFPIPEKVFQRVENEGGPSCGIYALIDCNVKPHPLYELKSSGMDRIDIMRNVRQNLVTTQNKLKERAQRRNDHFQYDYCDNIDREESWLLEGDFHAFAVHYQCHIFIAIQSERRWAYCGPNNMTYDIKDGEDEATVADTLMKKVLHDIKQLGKRDETNKHWPHHVFYIHDDGAYERGGRHYQAMDCTEKDMKILEQYKKPNPSFMFSTSSWSSRWFCLEGKFPPLQENAGEHARLLTSLDYNGIKGQYCFKHRITVTEFGPEEKVAREARDKGLITGPYKPDAIVTENIGVQILNDPGLTGYVEKINHETGRYPLCKKCGNPSGVSSNPLWNKYMCYTKEQFLKEQEPREIPGQTSKEHHIQMNSHNKLKETAKKFHQMLILYLIATKSNKDNFKINFPEFFDSYKLHRQLPPQIQEEIDGNYAILDKIDTTLDDDGNIKEQNYIADDIINAKKEKIADYVKAKQKKIDEHNKKVKMFQKMELVMLRHENERRKRKRKNRGEIERTPVEDMELKEGGKFGNFILTNIKTGEKEEVNASTLFAIEDELDMKLPKHTKQWLTKITDDHLLNRVMSKETGVPRWFHRHVDNWITGNPKFTYQFEYKLFLHIFFPKKMAAVHTKMRIEEELKIQRHKELVEAAKEREAEKLRTEEEEKRRKEQRAKEANESADALRKKIEANLKNDIKIAQDIQDIFQRHDAYIQRLKKYKNRTIGDNDIKKRQSFKKYYLDNKRFINATERANKKLIEVDDRVIGYITEINEYGSQYGRVHQTRLKDLIDSVYMLKDSTHNLRLDESLFLSKTQLDAIKEYKPRNKDDDKGGTGDDKEDTNEDTTLINSDNNDDYLDNRDYLAAIGEDFPFFSSAEVSTPVEASETPAAGSEPPAAPPPASDSEPPASPPAPAAEAPPAPPAPVAEALPPAPGPVFGPERDDILMRWDEERGRYTHVDDEPLGRPEVVNSRIARPAIPRSGSGRRSHREHPDDLAAMTRAARAMRYRARTPASQRRRVVASKVSNPRRSRATPHTKRYTRRY